MISCSATREACWQRWLRALLAGTLAGLWPVASTEAGVRRIWAVHDGERIERDDQRSALSRGNTVWDGKAVRVFGARNEIVAFQVIVESDGQGVRTLSAALPGLTHTSGHEIRYHPPAPDPSVTVGRPIQIFSTHYMHVTRESRASWVWAPGSAAAPADTLGWKPVQLVPENARTGRGGFPLAVPANNNQAFWIEIDTGRDRPAGQYQGTIAVVADGVTSTIPITLAIFDFALPDRPTLPVMIYYEPGQPELYHGRNLDPAYHRFAHRHRVELVHGYSEQGVRDAAGRFDGSDFTPARGYEGPGERVGNRVVPATFYGPARFADAKEAWSRADAWMTFVQRTVPGALTFVYLPDEPAREQFPMVRAIADRLHGNPGPGAKLPTFLTRRIEPALTGAIDIWSLPPQHVDLRAVAAEQHAGRRAWFYNHGRPNGPALVIDAPATDGRVVGWAAFKHRLDGYFYWHGVHWRHNSQKQGDRNQNVWADPITFDNRGQPNKPLPDQGFINGDGVLFYPGEDRVHPDEDRGIPGPIGTVHLANLRRGLQDLEYLATARRLGLDDVVQESLSVIVPRVFSDAGSTIGFAEHGDVFEKARRRLAEAIVKNGHASK